VSVIAEGQGKVTRDRMIGAFCGYILLGITWATFYYLLESFSPGSFNNTRELLISSGESSLPRITVELADFVYFSLVTLTTLGYGDILPVNRQAKSLAIMEAMGSVRKQPGAGSVKTGSYSIQSFPKPGIGIISPPR